MRCRGEDASAALVASLALVLVSVPSPAAAGVTCDWDTIEPLPARRATVQGLQLTRDYLGLTLEAGELYGLRACDRTVGLVFVGQGSVEVRSPGPQRTPQLNDRFVDLPGKALLDAVLLLGADGALEQLIEEAGGLQEGPVPPSVWSLTQSRMNGFLSSNPDGWRPPGEVLAAPEPGLGGLLIDVRTRGVRSTRPERSLEVLSPWLTYVWAPTGPLGDPREPGLLLRRANGSTRPLLYGGLPSEESVAAQGTPYALVEPSPAWDLEEVTLSLAASGPLGPDRQLDTLQGSAELELTARTAGRHVLLDLEAGVRRVYGDPWAPNRVLGVLELGGGAGGADAGGGDAGSGDADGDAGSKDAPLEWLQTGDRLWVTLPQPVSAGAVVRLRVDWRGQVLEPRGRTAIRMLAGWAWYPRTPWPDRHRFTASVAVPAFWEVAGTGHRIGEDQQGTVKVVTMREREPVLGGAVAIADVRTQVLKPSREDLPLVRVHRGAEQPVPNARIEAELWEVMGRLAELLGPYPYSELEIVERGPGTVGLESAPGMIALASFDSPPNQVVTSRVGVDTLLGALARQWIGVHHGGGSYHDAWLTEGLVTWARCLVLEAVDQGARCHGGLAASRRAWVDSMTGAGLAADPVARELLSGAIWLDQSSGSPWANRAQRGPLVLHALRMLVGDEVVAATLRTLGGGADPIELASFLTVIQAAAQIDLRAFIYGWVLNTPALPTASLRYQVEQTGETWTLSGLGQILSGRETSPALPLPTPILIAFDVAGESVMHRLLLTEVEAALRIEGLPAKPKNVRLDPGSTFPGKVKVERL